MDRARNWWQGIDAPQQHMLALEGSISAAGLAQKELAKEIAIQETLLDQIAESGTEAEFMVTSEKLASLQMDLNTLLQHTGTLRDQKKAMSDMTLQREQAATMQATANHMRDYHRSGDAHKLVQGAKVAYKEMDYVQGAANVVHGVRQDSKTNRNMVQMQMAARRRRGQMKVGRTALPATNHAAISQTVDRPQTAPPLYFPKQH